MSTTFGELKLRSNTPPPLPHQSQSVDYTDEPSQHHLTGDENLTGFATIDLNGTNPSASSMSMTTNSSTTGGHHTAGADVSYTSFERATAAVNSFSNPTPPHYQHHHSTAVNARNMMSTSIHESPSSSSPSSMGNTNGMISPSMSSSSSASISTSSPNNNNNNVNIMSTAGEVSSRLAHKTLHTLEHIRLWSKSAYKCTRQIVSEKLGKSNRTVDPDIETAIEQIRDVRRKYENILTLSNSMAAHFRDMLHTQRLMGENFAELAQKSPELFDEFTVNSETQRQTVKNGETLLEEMNQFNSSLRTLCHKTIEDTLTTVRNFEAARLEYDAYKADLENLRANTSPNETDVVKTEQLRTLASEVTDYREKYERLKSDVTIKLKFLDENRIKVMRKQLVLYQHAIFVYFSNNRQSLEGVMRQFKISDVNAVTGVEPNRVLDRNPDSTQPTTKFQTFLEKN